MDEYLEALANEHRRQILATLTHREELSVDDAIVRRTAGAEVGDTQRLALYHVHLPKLDALDLIEWDEEAETLRPGKNFDDIQPLIEATQEINGSLR